MRSLATLSMMVWLSACAPNDLHFSKVIPASCDHCQEVTVAGRTVSVSGDHTATVSISSVQSIALGRDPTRENRSWVALLSLSPDEGQMLRRMFGVLDEVLVAVDGAPHFVVPGADVGPSVVVRGNEKEVTQFAAAIRVPARILPTVDAEAVRAAARARAESQSDDDEELYDELSQRFEELGLDGWEDLREWDESLERRNTELSAEIEELRRQQ